MYISRSDRFIEAFGTTFSKEPWTFTPGEQLTFVEYTLDYADESGTVYLLAVVENQAGKRFNINPMEVDYVFDAGWDEWTMVEAVTALIPLSEDDVRKLLKKFDLLD